MDRKQRCEIASDAFHFPSIFKTAVSSGHFKSRGGEQNKTCFLAFRLMDVDWLWQAMWLNQLQQAYHTLSVMEQPHTDTLIEIQTESTMTNRLPISSSVCRELFTRSKGCSEGHRGSLWVISSGHLIVTLMHVLLPCHMMSHERSEKQQRRSEKAHRHTCLPPPDSPRHQLWQAPVISSAVAFQSIS